MNHQIRKFTTELACPDPGLAVDLQARIPGFVAGELARVLDDVLEAVCPERETVRLNRLVVDLGALDPEDFQRQMAARLRASLTDALQKEIGARRSARSAFEDISYRLFTIIGSGSRQNIDPYWIPLTALYAADTRDLFRKKGQSPLIRKHIAWVFPQERIKELVRLFEPFHHRFITYFLDRPETLMVKDALGTTPQGAFRQQVTEFILAYLFAEQGSRFNKKVFLGSVISQVSSHYNIRYQGFLLALIRLFQASRKASKVRREILAYLLELAAGEDESLGTAAPDREFSLAVFAGDGPDSARERVGDFSKDHSRGLARLLARDPGSVAAFLTRYRKRPSVIRRLAAALDGQGLARLVEQVHPGRSEAVLRYAGILAQGDYARLFSDSDKRAEVLVREAVLVFEPPFEARAFLRNLIGTLSLARGGETGRDRFLSRLIIRLVLDARKNRAHYDLLRAVLELHGLKSGMDLLRREGVETLDNAVAFFRHYLARKENRRKMADRFSRERLARLIRLIHPFEHDFIRRTLAVAEDCLSEARGRSASGIRIRIHAVTLDLMAEGCSGTFSRKNFVAGILRELSSASGLSFKAQLLAFRHRLEGQQDASVRSLIATAAEIEADIAQERKLRTREYSAKNMVMMYLTRILPERGNETSYLMNAVKRYESRASDRGAYYAAILDKLIRNRTIDFEAVIGASPRAHPAADAVSGGTEGFGGKIRTLLADSPLLLLEFVRSHLDRPGFRDLLVSSLSVTEMNRLVYLLRPRDYLRIRGAVDILEKGLLTAFGIAAGKALDRMVWLGVFSGMARSDRFHDLDFAVFSAGFCTAVSSRMSTAGMKRFYTKMARALSGQSLSASGRDIREAVIRGLASVSDPGGTGVARLASEAAPDPPKAPAAAKEPAEPPRPIETLYPDNAGLVLAAPYLPSLFSALHLTEGRRFISSGAALTGVRVLQYMADPESRAPLSHLVLNRILCGLDPPLPEDTFDEPGQAEKDTADSLIRGMIRNWKIVQNTSVQGFRESFFQRRGVLTLEPDGAFHLKVEKRAFDMLLDSIPWQFATVRLPWMSRVLHTRWR